MPPANLAALCPNLQPLTEGTGAAVIRWAVGTVKTYQDCQDKHAGLVVAWPK